ncbi:MAG: hypothetical protein WC303_01500 [Candidatus Paceibacterota bacterium]|jgi:hypothetical protein
MRNENKNERKKINETDELMKSARRFFIKKYHPDNTETGDAEKFKEIYKMFEENNLGKILLELNNELPRGETDVKTLFKKKGESIKSPELDLNGFSVNLDLPPLEREIPPTNPPTGGIHRVDPSEDLNPPEMSYNKKPTSKPEEKPTEEEPTSKPEEKPTEEEPTSKPEEKPTEEEPTEEELKTDFKVGDLENAQGRAFGGAEASDSNLENFKKSEKENIDNLKNLENAQGRAFGGAEASDSDDVDFKNINKNFKNNTLNQENEKENNLKNLENAQGRAFGGAEASDSDDVDFKDTNKNIDELKDYLSYQNLEELTPNQINSEDYFEIKEEEPAETQEPAEKITEPSENLKKEKTEREINLERKNKLIQENKDIIVSYVKTKEKIIQLQDQIEKDAKILNRFKKFLTSDSKTNLTEEYIKACNLLKEKEREIEEKTGASQNDLLQLWEQYKQFKSSKKEAPVETEQKEEPAETQEPAEEIVEPIETLEKEAPVETEQKEEPAETQEPAEEIVEPIETLEKESDLERKNKLIQEYKDIVFDYVKIKEKSLQLQDQIEKDNKLTSKIKRFLTNAPKSNLIEEHERIYELLKEKELELEEKTGVSQDDLLQLWEQYKQFKEKQKKPQP